MPAYQRPPPESGILPEAEERPVDEYQERSEKKRKPKKKRQSEPFTMPKPGAQEIVERYRAHDTRPAGINYYQIGDFNAPPGEPCSKAIISGNECFCRIEVSNGVMCGKKYRVMCSTKDKFPTLRALANHIRTSHPDIPHGFGHPHPSGTNELIDFSLCIMAVRCLEFRWRLRNLVHELRLFVAQLREWGAHTTALRTEIRSLMVRHHILVSSRASADVIVADRILIYNAHKNESAELWSFAKKIGIVADEIDVLRRKIFWTCDMIESLDRVPSLGKRPVAWEKTPADFLLEIMLLMPNCGLSDPRPRWTASDDSPSKLVREITSWFASGKTLQEVLSILFKYANKNPKTAVQDMGFYGWALERYDRFKWEFMVEEAGLDLTDSPPKDPQHREWKEEGIQDRERARAELEDAREISRRAYAGW